MSVDLRSVRALAHAAADEIRHHLGAAAVPIETTTPGSSRCARGDRCEAAERLKRYDQRSQLVGAPTDQALCPACRRATPAALAAAPQLYVDLRNAAMVRTSSTTSEYVSRSPGSPLGINGSPFAHAQQLHWWITAWADQVIWTAGRPSPDRAGQSEGQQVDDACVLLTRYLSAWLAHRPVEFQITRGDADPDDPKADPRDATVVTELAGWEGCAWLLDWRATAERILGRPPLIHHPPEPCPACNVAGVLRRRDGDDKVSCSNCRKEWTLDMYEVFVHAWVGSR